MSKYLFDIKVEKECSICYEELEIKTAHVTGCKHSFHKECIKKWLSVKDTCPICRDLLITRTLINNTNTN